jgi:hypothetical protein
MHKNKEKGIPVSKYIGYWIKEKYIGLNLWISGRKM